MPIASRQPGGPATLVAGAREPVSGVDRTGVQLARRVRTVAPKVNRREAIGTAGTGRGRGRGLGRHGADTGPGQSCRARAVCPASGRSGADDRCPGGGGGPAVRAGSLRLRHPRGPEQRALGRLQGLRPALLPGRPRGLGQRHGRRRGPGHRRGRRLLRRARPRTDQRHDRHRRGPLRQRPDRRHRHRRRPRARRADRPGPRAAERGHCSARSSRR